MRKNHIFPLLFSFLPAEKGIAQANYSILSGVSLYKKLWYNAGVCLHYIPNDNRPVMVYALNGYNTSEENHKKNNTKCLSCSTKTKIYV